jgi:hypothetical protein
MKRTFALPATILALSLACTDAPAGPDNTAFAPQFNFLTGPSELPNVFRFGTQFVTAIFDPQTGLVALAGAPADPAAAVPCGGDDPFAFVAVQDAGVIQDVLHRLVVGPEVNLHVYDFATFINPCVSTPIAQGTGRVMYVDNDAFNAGPGANSWGFRMHGEVTLTSGESAHLEAHNRFIIWPNGEFRRIYRQVRLSSQ